MDNDLQIADYIIIQATHQHINLDNVKLQNTMLFLNTIYQNKYHHPLFKSIFTKSIYGVIIKDIYAEYQNYGGSNLNAYDNHLVDYNTKAPNWGLVFEKADPKKLDSKVRNFLDKNIFQFLMFERFELAQYALDNPYLKRLKSQDPIDTTIFNQYYKKPNQKFWKQVKL